MALFIAGRTAQGALVLLAVSVVVFLLSFLSGDPAALMLPAEATPAQIAEFRQEMGFDQPVFVQYWDFLVGALTLDFGVSYFHGDDALGMVLERTIPTLQLTLAAMVVALLIAIPLATVAALRRGSVIDRLVGAVAMLGQSLPHFFVGIVLLIVFTVRLGWLPAIGSPTARGLVLPALTLGLYATAETMRLLRSNLLEVLHEDYVRTARAKGVSRAGVMVRHAMRNAVIPVITVLSLQVGTLLGGAVITETVFSYPGMGLLAVQSIANRDFLVIQAFVLIVAAIVVFLNVVLDIVYGLVDPRIRFEVRQS
ncbi:ABC transporter permease [Nonomuraea sp. MG754425]|uniref:ABC transporter permease n=1 Tax=Nonomuraea sp. MG754425 TaxID=2570319 RepID=UPI001F397D37|nr:ABC transporter permease [Nonomuraea sp. MG754425]